MDPQLSEKNEKMKTEKKIIARKVLELSNSFKSTIARIESKIDEKFEAFENKFDDIESKIYNRCTKVDTKLENMSIDLEGIQKDEVKLSDDISKLETEKAKVARKIEIIDQTLQEFSDKIVELEKPIENRKDEQANNENDIRKPCKFNNRGYCRGKESCQFFHAETICVIYRETGLCWKPICRERHPKTCRYSGECYRGESCRYLHHELSCDKCEKFATFRYHCEFCNKDFCERCTSDEAHTNNIYINNENPKCSNIHQ